MKNSVKTESEKAKRQSVEYKVFRQENHYALTQKRNYAAVFLGLVQILFVILFGIFSNYKIDEMETNGNIYSSKFLQYWQRFSPYLLTIASFYQVTLTKGW